MLKDLEPAGALILGALCLTTLLPSVDQRRNIKGPNSRLRTVPVGNVLGSVGEGEEDVSQRRQGQTLSPAPLSGPADVRLTASQVQEVETTATRH